MSSPTTPAWLRAGRDSRQDIYLDLLTLVALALLLIATGIGLRDPWPADEPRFALIARDMVASGQWLVPHVGNDLYADKPPLFFWLQAVFLVATGSPRVAFLLPSLLSAIGCVVLIYDMSRRLWNRETGLVAGLLLLVTLQFVWQARQAQIDATLCFWTTLSLYALLRHALLGPRWGWYVTGWAAAGLGVITKGVGFLPLLMLLPLALLHWRWRNTTLVASARWISGPLAFLAAMCVWALPMLTAAHDDPALQAYRDEILFKQTIERYAQAWHHHEPFWYFLVEVIPLLWLPLTLLLPWLIPRWIRAWREREVRVIAPLLWCALVVVFFSASAGKRGVYVLPAVPALVLAVAPYLRELMNLRTVRRAVLALGALIPVITGAAIAYLFIRSDVRQELIADYGLDPLGPLIVITVVAALVCVWAYTAAGRARAPWAYVGALMAVLVVVSFWVNPVMNDVRSGRAFVRTVETAADPLRELAFMKFKEQYLLYLQRPIVHFGHARWSEEEAESEDAARWFSERPGRQLVVTEYSRARCFPHAHATALGSANRIRWFLVDGGSPESWCIERGRPAVAISYTAPSASHAGR